MYLPVLDELALLGERVELAVFENEVLRTNSRAVIATLQRLLDRIDLALDSIDPVEEYLFILCGMSHPLLLLSSMIRSRSIVREVEWRFAYDWTIVASKWKPE